MVLCSAFKNFITFSPFPNSFESNPNKYSFSNEIKDI